MFDQFLKECLKSFITRSYYMLGWLSKFNEFSPNKIRFI